MANFLYHPKTGDFYVLTSLLAKRDDMESVEADSLDAAKEIVANRNAENSVKLAQADEVAADEAAEKALKAAETAERKRKAAEEKAAKVAADKAAKLAAKQAKTKNEDLFA